MKSPRLSWNLWIARVIRCHRKAACSAGLQPCLGGSPEGLRYEGCATKRFDMNDIAKLSPVSLPVLAARPRVSVIIPTYNCREYISEAIESVFQQTFTDYEIIVVDDGSTDGTESKVAEYLDRVILLRQENRGPAVARNRGIRAARGELIAFLDGDDIWYPDKLAAQVEFMDSHPEVALVYADCTTFDKQGVKTVGYDRTHREVYSGWVFDQLFVKNFIACITVMLRKKCLDEVGLFPENFDKATSEDWHLWLRIAKDHRVGYIDRPMVKYRWKQNSLTGDYTYAYPYRLMVLDDMVALYPDYFRRHPGLLRRAYGSVLMRYGYALFKAGQEMEAKNHLDSSIRCQPLQFKAYLYRLGLAVPPSGRRLIVRVKSILGWRFMPAE